MTTRTAKGNLNIDLRRTAAIIAGLGSFATTWLFVAALGFDDIGGFFAAVAVEFLLAAGKHAILHGKPDALGEFSIGIDTLLNAGGLWPYVLNLPKTAIWAMLGQSLNLDQQLHFIPALVVALAIGFLLSALPFWLWRK